MSLSSSLACVIVHYGELQPTLACVDSLIKAERRPWIVLVCNTEAANSDQLVKALQESYPHLDITPDEERGTSDALILPQLGNRGFAAACNVGLRALRKQPGIRHVWLLNNDTVAAPDAPAILEDCLEKQPRAVLGTAVYDMGRPDHLELALGYRFHPLTTRLQPCFAHARLDEVPGPPEVDYVYGASLAFPLRLVAEIGGFDERFFLYYEEHDFCVRAKKAGYAFMWCPEVRVWHKGGGSSKIHEPGRPSPARVETHYHENLSTFRFLRKHYPYLLPVAIVIRTLSKGVLLPLRGEAVLLRGYARALRDFLRSD